MQEHVYNLNINNQVIDLAYVEWGDPQNPKTLVCVHGLTRNSRDFDFVAAALQHHYRVVAVDIPGRGRSSWLANALEYNNMFYAGVMAQFLAEKNITQCHWLGTSMGSLIAMGINAMQPGLIQKWVINDIGPFLSQAAIARIATYASQRPVFQNHSHAKQYFKNMYVSFGITNDAHFDHIAQHSVRPLGEDQLTLHYDPAVIEPFKLMAGKGDADLWQLWPATVMPTLVIRGAKSDLLTPDILARMCALGPHIQSVEIPGCGHAPALMDPTQIALVKNYLLEQ